MSLRGGNAALGFSNGTPGPVEDQVSDGDTVKIHALKNFGVRFLSVDAAEKNINIPGDLGHLDGNWDEGLLHHLENHLGPDATANQHHHAMKAKKILEQEIINDIKALDQSEEDFRFYIKFAFEKMDRYERFLCYINRYQPGYDPERDPPSYNVRLLEKAVVSPYFIWPNVDPWRKRESVYDAVVKPFTANDEATDNGKNMLKIAREWIKDARQNEEGVFDVNNPLKVQPFEARFLKRRKPPDRWVINLSKDDNILINPQNYYTIPNVEDRLFIPREYLPLFEDEERFGDEVWQRQL